MIGGKSTYGKSKVYTRSWIDLERFKALEVMVDNFNTVQYNFSMLFLLMIYYYN